MNKNIRLYIKKCVSMTAIAMLTLTDIIPFANNDEYVYANDDVITLRVCNWEEYIDLGDWDESIELDNGTEIMGENTMYDDFEKWYYETYHQKVKVEYSCFGTNEDLYNQLTLGDTYDIVCPSDYMIMKLMAEDKAEPYSDEFFDVTNEYNYYAKCVSPYISKVFKENKINGNSWDKYAACYMWGTTGVLYNPEYMTKEEASTWAVFDNDKFKRQITLKDNVRDTYFAALGYYMADTLTNPEFIADKDYTKKLANVMNDVSKDTIDNVEDVLRHIMGNIYALETDSGKSDMVTGKIIANYQWSGDAVYAMDLADEDGVTLNYAVPKECTNLWFDGWIMLKSGIDGNTKRKHAAEAFVNYLSRPDNAVRNMYYIGYTSAISGGDDDTILEYVNYCYGNDDNVSEDEIIHYDISYFFSNNDKEKYIIETNTDCVDRQLFAQYPTKDIIDRTAIMGYFDEEETKYINQMWINIRCVSVKDIPIWVFISIFGVIVTSIIIYKLRKIKV